MKRLLINCSLLLIVIASTAQFTIEKEMKNSSTEIIRYKVSPEMHAAFEKAYSEAGAYLKQSAFCLGYQLLHGDEEPDNYIVIINWTSKDDHLNKFRNSLEFKSFFQLVRPYYNNIQEMKHYLTSDTRWIRE